MITISTLALISSLTALGGYLYGFKIGTSAFYSSPTLLQTKQKEDLCAAELLLEAKHFHDRTGVSKFQARVSNKNIEEVLDSLPHLALTGIKVGPSSITTEHFSVAILSDDSLQSGFELYELAS